MSIRLITFDLDDTLWDNRPVILGAEAAMRDWLALHTPRLAAQPVEHLWTIRSRLVENEPGLRHRLSELRRRTLFHALEGVGYSREEAVALAEGAFQAMLRARHRITFFPETVPTLEALAGRYHLGVITNGNADVRRLGLADYFQFALCAEELGVGKPDPKPFREALKKVGVTAEQAVHVGDHPGDDIRGALDAGLRAIWFNPSGQSWDGEDSPDSEIRSLGELPALLKRWGA
ncbi:HAD family hydrolase [Zestomonas carbonaria]|uniref:5-amino-6-(5-phospho-D-ribitylamino)uracil phosphatase YigB n=1 Tax=Zestomonas carbonaria TaxID=2762745 RepID=A0A7U7EJZ5_9GAMM|nr:HAD-IA family hydrolase [Pseudomonas carbonaria]CAD5106335.1 5-amino-6-(5-phospho-D-ribitylamino)uracil phosphatase YigB [Pseudomonas carbonaria]